MRRSGTDRDRARGPRGLSRATAGLLALASALATATATAQDAPAPPVGGRPEASPRASGGPSAPAASSPGAAGAGGSEAAPGGIGAALNTSPGAGGPTQPQAANVAPTAEEEAEKPPPTNFLMQALGAPDAPVQLYGWIQNSFTGNANGRPRDDFNFGVFPNHQADQWQGNQYYFILENVLESDSDEVNFGFRFDTLFGNDWEFTKSYGLFDRAFHPGSFAGVDLPQMYASVHLPWLTEKGIDVIGGRFYSIAGFESAQAVKRPLLSVPYLFNFTPFTFFGALTTLRVNERFNVYNGAVNGWDRWVDARYRYSYIGGINYTWPGGKTTLTSVIVAGPDQLPSFAPANSPFLPTGVVTNQVLQGHVNPYYGRSTRVYMSNVLKHDWSKKLTEAAEVFFVHENSVPGLGPGPPTHVNNENAWYGGAHWLLYQLTPKVTGVYRAEVFRDQNGGATGDADTFYEQTVGLIFKPKPWLWVRPEARYDWAQSTHPFNDGTRGSQLTLAFDIIVQF